MDRRLSLRTLLCSGLIGLATAAGDSFQSSPPPPDEYAALYQELDQKITDYDQHLNSVWDGTIRPVTFLAESWYANSNNGTGLLDPANYTNFSTEIARLKAMRLGAVSLSVHFPYLYQPYDPVNYPLYIDFYKRAVREIRAQGQRRLATSPTGS